MTKETSRKKSLFRLLFQENKSASWWQWQKWQKAKGMATGAGSWESTSSNTQTKHTETETQKQSKVLKLSKPTLQWHISPSKIWGCKDFKTSPSSTTNWASSVWLAKQIGRHFHSNHHIALAEDLSFIHSTHNRLPTTTRNSSSRWSDVFFWSPVVPPSTFAHSGIHTYTK